jgi:hypothetical protein
MIGEDRGRRGKGPGTFEKRLDEPKRSYSAHSGGKGDYTPHEMGDADVKLGWVGAMDDNGDLFQHLSTGRQPWDFDRFAVVHFAGRLRRGYFIILPPPFSFVWRIPIVTRNAGDE